MKCPYCQSDVDTNAKFCQGCGADISNVHPVVEQPVVETPVVEQPIINNSNNTTNNQPRRKKTATASTLILIIIIAICIFGYKMLNKDNSSSGNDGEKTNNTEKQDNNNNIKEDSEAFILYVEDVFTITGRGTVVTGRVYRGSIKLYDKVQLIRIDGTVIDTEVTGIEKFRSQEEEAVKGDNVGLLLKDVERTQVERGDTVVLPNSIKTSKTYEVELQIREDANSDGLLSDKNNQQISLSDITYDVESIKLSTSSVKPGDTVKATITLEDTTAFVEGSDFRFRENNRVVAEGTIIKKK